MTIAEFLSARIAEEEVLMGDAFDHWGPGLEYFECDEIFGVAISRSRLLAECAAKRAIVEFHTCSEGGMEVWLDLPDAAWTVEQWGDFTPGYYSRDACLCCSDLTLNGAQGRAWPCRTLRALAAAYADHPDYDPRWAL